MSAGILLAVGLANPGAEYQETRHNAGAWFIDRLCRVTQTALRRESKFHALYTQAQLEGVSFHLAIPTTYMNLSGQAVQALLNFYKLEPQQILIIHDEIDLPPGDIRLKFNGGHGGHNGLRDIIRHLGSNQFYRLRVGVGHPGNSKLVHDYVLHPPKKSEAELINNGFDKAEALFPLLLKGEFQKAMQELHTNNQSKN